MNRFLIVLALILGITTGMGVLSSIAPQTTTSAAACDDVFGCDEDLKSTEPIIIACNDPFGCEDDLKSNDPIILACEGFDCDDELKSEDPINPCL